MATDIGAEPLTLWPIAGPSLAPVRAGEARQLVIGRAAECAPRLEHASVSRRHANLAWRSGRWFAADLKSKHGTFLNGVRIEGDGAVPVAAGDLLTIGPWTFRLQVGARQGSTIRSQDDAGRTPSVRPAESRERSMAASRLHLLMDAAERLQGAPDEAALAREVARAVVEGTSYTRAALLRSQGESDRVELLGSAERSGGRPPSAISRSLLTAAAAGEIVQLDSAPSLREAVSIVQGGIAEALCAPVRVGPAVDAFLYADCGPGGARPDADAAPFVAALARLCGLAIAGLRRISLERQQGEIVREMERAREIQARMMPRPKGRAGPLRFAFASAPGRVVAGDICGVEEQGEGRATLFIGDVTGKGFGPSLLMASVQAFLRAGMVRAEPAEALVHGVNNHLATQVGEGDFASLWLATVEPDGLLRCVDAGHGLAVCVGPAGARRIEVEGGFPLGVSKGDRYPCSELRLGGGERLVLFSDGLKEQENGEGEQFGIERVLGALGPSGTCEDDVGALLDALRRFAGTEAFADDITVASFQAETP